MSRSGNAFAIKDPCSPQRSRFPSTGFKKKLRSSLRPCSKKDTHPVVRGHRRVVPVVCKACRFSPLSAAEDVTLNPFAYIRMNIQHIDSNMLADKKKPSHSTLSVFSNVPSARITHLIQDSRCTRWQSTGLCLLRGSVGCSVTCSSNQGLHKLLFSVGHKHTWAVRG